MSTTLFLNKKRVLTAFGGAKSLAEKYGITRNAIYMWPDVLSGKTAAYILFVSGVYGVDISEAVIRGGEQAACGKAHAGKCRMQDGD